MGVALLALFVALGGTGYAAVALKRNSVATKHLKANAVISSKIRDRSLRARDFARNQLPAGPQGPQGPQGAQGIQGNQGVPGEPASRLWVMANADGTLYRGSVDGISTERAGPGEYIVTFPTDISGCAPLADVGGHPLEMPGSNTGLQAGYASTTASSAGGTYMGKPVERLLSLNTYDENGVRADRDFHAVVFC